MSLYKAHQSLLETPGVEVTRQEPLRRHTTYRIGGLASLFVTCNTYSSLTHAVELLDAENVRWVLMGKGSNVLASDDGFDGCVIVLGQDFKNYSFSDDGKLVAGAAMSLSKLLNEAMRASRSGLEMLTGVPGTLGGALAMNAGSRHEWISSVVENVVVYRPGFGMCRYNTSDIDWGYRFSSIPVGEIILEASLDLKEKDSQLISADMDRRLIHKRATQPITEASCGSVFKNPETGPGAAELIVELGLQNYSCGEACISEKHANFIVNKGSATSDDVLAIIRHVHEKVKEGYGIDLQTEVRFLGFA